MAKFYIPSSNCKSDPSFGITPDVIFDLDRLLPSEAIVCIGLDAYDPKRENERDIDLVVITKTAVHVIESKDKYGEPVIYKNNEGLFIKHENGSKTYIMNNDESARDQARECVHTVDWGFWRASRKLKTCLGYILVPHAFEGSNLYELTGLVRGCKSVEELVQLISRRDANAIRKQRANQFSIQEMEETVKIQFGVHQTDTIKGYKIGDTPPPHSAHKNAEFNKQNDETNYRKRRNERQPSNTQETHQHIDTFGKIIFQSLLSILGFIKKKKLYCASIGLVLFLMFFLLHGLTSQRGCFNGSIPLNIRAAPNSQSDKVGSFDKGECFFVNGISSDEQWIRIGGLTYSGNWVYAQYVDGLDLGKLLKIKNK
ncbi:MAG: SH3 domain-containing protein [Proteobacteria bacterium]|nr:SH3 domain-containing protein [Pseudomonadota bacterium]